MKKIKLFALGLIGASMFLTSCEPDDDNDDALAPTLNITELTSGSNGGDVTINQGETLVFAWDSRRGDADIDLFEVEVSGSNTPNPIPTSNQGNDFPYDVANADDETYIDTLVFVDAGLNLGVTNYTFTSTDRDGESKSVTFTVTVASSLTEVTGAFFHIGGSLQGAYDLVTDQVVSASGPAADKDLENTDAAGDPFTGSWAAANTTTFVKANGFDYDNATAMAASAAYAAGTSSASVTNPADGDIYIARVRGGSDYTVIKITDVDPSNNECTCGNTGKISFDYKK